MDRSTHQFDWDANDERDDASLVARFRAFHDENPHVYELFKRFALEVIRSGRTRLGVAMIWERMRWYAAFEVSGDEFKLNNNHRAYYARMFMSDFPEYEGFFETRRVRDEGEESDAA